MKLPRGNWLGVRFFPDRRFDPDFPLAFWFAGLWLYLKSFLYLCYLYKLGLDPPPYPPGAFLEIVYFAVAVIPAFLLGLGLWNEKRWVVLLAVAFFFVDTPFLIKHLFRLASSGYLEPGLTRVLEYGNLLLNIVATVWLIAFRTGQDLERSNRAASRR